jgi:hypothetical protein
VAMPVAIPAVWCRNSRRLEVDPLASMGRFDDEASIGEPFLVRWKTGIATAYQGPLSRGQVYELLGLPDFGVVEPAMRSYVASLSGYKKNTYPPLAPHVRERIAKEWQRSFEAWGYPT